MTDNPEHLSDAEVEFSVHSGPQSLNGLQVHISIYRLAGTDDQWTLEVENSFGGSTIWEDTFPTDDTAYAEFLATIAKDGIEQFVFDDPIVH